MTDSASPNTGRKARAMARNRARHIRSAQEVIISRGPDASINEFADHAEVAVATLYAHFGSKDGLVRAAVQDAIDQWEQWMEGVVAGVDGSLEQLVLSLRLALRSAGTHPVTAAITARTVQTNMAPLDQLGAGLYERIARLVQEGVLTADHMVLRSRALLAVAVAEAVRQASLPGPEPDDADRVLEWALPMLGITPATARRLAHAPMPELPPATA